jgi:predicted NUDIX family phosphoesterase
MTLLNTIGTKLIPRSKCETDLDTLQLIPYVVIRDINTGKYLSYIRGLDGDESKLHNKVSIGVGGHVDVEAGDWILSTLVTEAARELEEELGLDTIITIPLLADSVIQSSIIYSNEDKVSSVHVGISMLIEIDTSNITSNEENVITNLQLLDYTELLDTDRFDLEKWSYLALVNHHYNNIRTTPSSIEMINSIAHQSIKNYRRL